MITDDIDFKIIEGRNKFITHNNMCIIENISFLDYIFLDVIIKPVLFNSNYETINGIRDIIVDRLSFMDKYKIICKIADFYGIQRFKKIDTFISMRNNISHNITSVNSINAQTKESEILFGNEVISWTEYKSRLNNWCELSYELAVFIEKIISQIHSSDINCIIMYCKTEGDCVIVQHNIIYPSPDGEYTSFFKSGFNMDLLDYLNNEINYYKE